MIRLLSLLLLLATLLPAAAESNDTTRRPITSIYGIEAGRADMTSTYLSPLPYDGPGFALFGAWGKAMRSNPRHLVMAFTGGIELSRGLNPARSANMLAAAARFGWGPSWRYRFTPSLDMTLGGALDIYGGLLWLPRNGNNPVSAMAYAGLDITARLGYRTHFGRLPVTLADNVSLPTVGAFFSPAYGETYYEIYLGNHKGLAHAAWWGNAFGIDNHLTMTLHFGKRSLQLGYRLAVRTFHANNITTQYVRNAFTVALRIN